MPADTARVWYGALLHAQFRQQQNLTQEIPPAMLTSPALAGAATDATKPAILQIIPQPALPICVLQNLHARQQNCGVLVVQFVNPGNPASLLTQPLSPELKIHATEQLPLPPQHNEFASVAHPAQPHI